MLFLRDRDPRLTNTCPHNSSYQELRILSPAHGSVLPVGIPIVVVVRVARHDDENATELCGWSSVSGFQQRVCKRASEGDDTVSVVLPTPEASLIGRSDRVELHVECGRARANVVIFVDNVPGSSRGKTGNRFSLAQADRAWPSVLPFSLGFASPVAGAEVRPSFTVAPTISLEPEIGQGASSASALRRWLDM